MNLRPIAPNQTELDLDGGKLVFFSYQTRVAAFVPGEGFYRTEKKYSQTTTKHLNKWLISKGADLLRVNVVTQEWLDAL